MLWIIAFVLIVMLGSLLANASRKKAITKDKENLISAGIDPEKFITMGNYLGGITEITKSFKGVKLFRTSEGFDIYVTEEEKYGNKGHEIETRKIGKILNSEIKKIQVEDKSTSEKRMSVGNIAMFGPLGLAMRKTKNHDVAFLIITLFDGRFESEAVFSFELMLSNSTGKCFAIANESKAKIITHLKTLS